MNNYLLYSHVLKCSVIPEDKLDPNTFVGANKKFKVIPWAEIERKKKQELKSGAKYRKNVKNLLKKDEKKRKRLQELGIDYEFNGYVSFYIYLLYIYIYILIYINVYLIKFTYTTI